MKSISDNAFLGCTALSEINIPPETVYLGNNVFGSSLIEEISFPGSLKYIGKNNCPNTLKYIEMCDGIEFIPEHFADSCNNLREVNLPQTIKKIGYSAFPIEVQIPEECKIYTESEDARLENLPFDKFEYEGTVWVVRYDESDISVEPEDKKQLEGQIIIPEQHREYNITKIADNAFSGCEDITSIEIPNTIEIIGKGAFSGTNLNCDLVIPESVKIIGDEAFAHCNISSVLLNETLTEIGPKAFYGNNNISKVDIPQSVKKIGVDAFAVGEIHNFTIENENLIVSDIMFNGPINAMNSITETEDEENQAEEKPQPQNLERAQDSQNVSQDKQSETIDIDDEESSEKEDYTINLNKTLPLKIDTNISEAKADSTSFRVTVPSILPIKVDSSNNVLTATNAEIVNYGNNKVEVTSVNIQTQNNWKIVSLNTDFRSVPVNSKMFTFSINDNFFDEGTDVLLDIGQFWSDINSEENMSLKYSEDFAVQSEPITDLNIAKLIFKVTEKA